LIIIHKQENNLLLYQYPELDYKTQTINKLPGLTSPSDRHLSMMLVPTFADRGFLPLKLFNNAVSTAEVKIIR
jgi:hypothetical protein